MAVAMLLPVSKTHEYSRIINRHHNSCILLPYTECTLNTMFIAVTMDHKTIVINIVYKCHITMFLWLMSYNFCSVQMCTFSEVCSMDCIVKNVAEATAL